MCFKLHTSGIIKVTVIHPDGNHLRTSDKESLNVR